MADHEDESGATVIPPSSHARDRHYLPDTAPLALNTVARCTHCGRWFCYYIAEGWSGGYPAWFVVHWWHFRLRRRIRKQATAPASTDGSGS